MYGPNGLVRNAASISNVKSHKSAAIWASLSSIMESLDVDTEEIKSIYLITDSPTSQYRNCKTAFLTKKYGEEKKICIHWIFTEAGHGKGPMDGVGATVKNSIDDCTAFKPSSVISCASELLPLLPPLKVVISTYDQSLVDEFAKEIPKFLDLNWNEFGISQVHEIKFEPLSSEIQWKQLSKDTKYTTATFQYNKS